MLKGIVITVPDMQVLEETLKRDGLPYVEAVSGDKAALRLAMVTLGARPEEVLCLVETDAQEALARELGMYCIAYLNPQKPGEKLKGCQMLIEGFQEVDADFLRNIHTRALGLPVLIAETDRLLIREMTVQDLDDINALYEQAPYAMTEDMVTLEREEEEKRLQSYITYMYGFYQFGMWVVIEKASQKLIGRAGFGIADYLDFAEIDIGYLIGESHRRLGYAEEACRAILSYAKGELAFPQVSAYIDERNTPSLNLIEKLGFRREKEFAWQDRQVCRYLLTL